MLNIETAHQKTEVLVVGESEIQMMTNKGHNIQSQSQIRYLGARFDKKLSLEPQCNHVYSKIKRITEKQKVMTDYGTRFQRSNFLHSQCLGTFAHSLEGQPPDYLIKNKWYSKYQKLYCDELKEIHMLQNRNRERPISYSALLAKVKQRSFFNTHLYLGLNRINEIFSHNRPSELNSLLNEFLVVDSTSEKWRRYGPISPFRPSIGPEGQDLKTMRNIYYQGIYSGYYSLKMRVPPRFESQRHLWRDDFIYSWPYCFMKYFNALPRNIRALLGTFSFKYEIKKYFTLKCQHPAPTMYCHRCKPHTDTPDEKEDRELIDMINKSLLPETWEVKMSCPEEQEIFDYLLYDPKANWYFEKHGKPVNVAHRFPLHMAKIEKLHKLQRPPDIS